jgi:hypothetical protein
MNQPSLTTEQEKEIAESLKLAQHAEQKMKDAGTLLQNLSRKLDQKLGKQTSQ